MNLGAVVLYTEDIAALSKWYITRLDFYMVSENRNSAVLAGPNGFAIELRRGRSPEHPERVHLLFYTETLDPSLTTLRRKPISGLVGEPRRTNRGRRVVSMRDSAGHTLEIVEVDPVAATPNMSLDQKTSPGRTSGEPD